MVRGPININGIAQADFCAKQAPGHTKGLISGYKTSAFPPNNLVQCKTAMNTGYDSIKETARDLEMATTHASTNAFKGNKMVTPRGKSASVYRASTQRNVMS